MRQLLFFAIFGALFFSGCAGKMEYTPPIKSAKPIENSKIINKPKEVVWNSAIAELGKQFFVINNMDKASGFMNISFSGDPEKYIDCGNISSYVKNVHGERIYNFPASRASQTYEFFQMQPQTILFHINRRMSMEGRVNLVFEELAKSQTKVTVTTKYIITLEGDSKAAGYQYGQPFRHTMNFSTNSKGSFPSGTACISKGELEREILDLIK